jgi:hypothetical protein
MFVEVKFYVDPFGNKNPEESKNMNLKQELH